MFIDSHCHLDRLDLSKHDGSLAVLLEKAHARGVDKMLCVSVDLNSFPQMQAKVAEFDNVWISAGIHPCDVKDCAFDADPLRQAALQPKVIALGETGLDYHYEPETAEMQAENFIGHLKMGHELQLPIIVHTREAREDTIRIIQQHADLDVGGVLHCFTESLEMAKAALDLNYMISFSGIITFKNAAELREVVKAVPLDRMLIETDSPYLAPVPYRGKPNEPTYVPEVAQCVADLKGIRVEEVAEATAANFYKLFKKAQA